MNIGENSNLPKLFSYLVPILSFRVAGAECCESRIGVRCGPVAMIDQQVRDWRSRRAAFRDAEEGKRKHVTPPGRSWRDVLKQRLP